MKLSVPHVHIQMVNHCNYTCPECNHFSPQSAVVKNDIDVYLKHLSNLLKYCAPLRVNIAGGEPTLHPRFSHVLRRVQAFLVFRSIPITVITNGWWIKNEVRTVVEALRQLGKGNRIEISLHPENPLCEERMREKLTCFEFSASTSFRKSEHFYKNEWSDESVDRDSCEIKNCLQLLPSGMLARCPLIAWSNSTAVSRMFELNRSWGLFKIDEGDYCTFKSWLSGLPKCCSYCRYGMAGTVEHLSARKDKVNA